MEARDVFCIQKAFDVRRSGVRRIQLRERGRKSEDCFLHDVCSFLQR